ncbi:MAG: hypothetical protein IH961_10800, partial [Chloroflexi bacterium]|nr:hypothetical protein [Chloroflexota bacterium]
MPQTVTAQTMFEPVPLWAKIPHGITFRGDATSVGVDSDDNVYVFSRGNVPVTIFDVDGNYLGGWGEGEFVRPHGIFIDDNDDLFLIDDNGHYVQKRTKSGEVIFTLGTKNQPAEWQGGGICPASLEELTAVLNRGVPAPERNHAIEKQLVEYCDWQSGGSASLRAAQQIVALLETATFPRRLHRPYWLVDLRDEV